MRFSETGHARHPLAAPFRAGSGYTGKCLAAMLNAANPSAMSISVIMISGNAGT